MEKWKKYLHKNCRIIGNIPNLTKLMVVAESSRAVGDTEIAVFILKTNQKARTAFLDND